MNTATPEMYGLIADEIEASLPTNAPATNAPATNVPPSDGDDTQPINKTRAWHQFFSDQWDNWGCGIATATAKVAGSVAIITTSIIAADIIIEYNRKSSK